MWTQFLNTLLLLELHRDPGMILRLLMVGNPDDLVACGIVY